MNQQLNNTKTKRELIYLKRKYTKHLIEASLVSITSAFLVSAVVFKVLALDYDFNRVLVMAGYIVSTFLICMAVCFFIHVYWCWLQLKNVSECLKSMS